MTRDKFAGHDELDIDILCRTVCLKEHLGSGDVTLTIEDNDSVEYVGKLIRRALVHADGAIIKVREHTSDK